MTLIRKSKILQFVKPINKQVQHIFYILVAKQNMHRMKGLKELVGIFTILSVLFSWSCKTPKEDETKTVTKQLEIVENEVPSIMPYDTFSYTEFDHIASYLSGIKPADSVVAARPEFQNYAWKEFSKRFTKQWINYETNELKLINQWTNEHIEYNDSIFYPFSGPDFNYLNSFFPDAKFNMMIALESLGSVPNIQNMPNTQRINLLNEMEKSLYFNLECSFFRTFSMEDELNTDVLDGTIPLILLFIKSHGYEMVNIYPVSINDKGYLSADTSGMMYAHTTQKYFDNAASFIYRNPTDSSLHELIYMSLDLSNDGIDDNNLSAFLAHYINGNTVFLKAASYLCHKAPFTTIRDLMLDNADQIISDPSGIHFDDYDDNWDIAVHGQYIGPIKLFDTRMQESLKTYCEEAGNANLPFRFGYHYTHWSLIDAKRK